MSEPRQGVHSVFQVSETVDSNGLRKQFVDGNNAEAEALAAQEFWAAIIGKSAIKAFDPPLSMDLQEFFGNAESPDELVVVSPLHNTNESTPIRQMHVSCMVSIFAMIDTSKLFLPALNWSEPDSDVLIRVDQADWRTMVPHHNNASDKDFTVFRAVRTRLPRGFLNPTVSNLSMEQNGIMLSNLTQTETPTN